MMPEDRTLGVPRPSGSSKAKREGLMRRRARVEQWISEERSPIREVELIQQRLDLDAQLAQIDQAQRLPELEEAFVKAAASWAKRTGISAAALREVGVPASVLRQAGAAVKGGSGRHQPDQIPSASPVSDPTTPSTVSCSRS
jgi:hypothetical protein